MNSETSAKDVVMSYIKNLDEYKYDDVENLLSEKVQVIGPAGESFKNPKEFLNMLRIYKAKYDIKKVFVDGNEVCLLYDMKTPKVTAYTASWYRVKNNKIEYIRSIFDSKLFN